MFTMLPVKEAPRINMFIKNILEPPQVNTSYFHFISLREDITDTMVSKFKPIVLDIFFPNTNYIFNQVNIFFVLIQPSQYHCTETNDRLSYCHQ